MTKFISEALTKDMYQHSKDFKEKQEGKQFQRIATEHQTKRKYDSYNMTYLKGLMDTCYDTKQPLFVFGDPGIGKTTVLTEFAEHKCASENRKIDTLEAERQWKEEAGKSLRREARETNKDKTKADKIISAEPAPVTSSVGKRKYVRWREIENDYETQMEIINNPTEYFVLVEQNTLGMDPIDVKGYPRILGNQIEDSLGSGTPKGKAKAYDLLRTIQHPWVIACCTEGLNGILYFDEMNAGLEDTQRSLFSVFDGQRKLAQRPLSSGIVGFASGNLPGSFQGKPLLAALVNRMDVGILVAEPDEWCELAEKNDVSIEIINYIRKNPEDNFYYNANDIKSDTESGEEQVPPFISPRALMAFDEQFKRICENWEHHQKTGQFLYMPTGKNMINEIHKQASRLLGIRWADGFRNFIIQIMEIDYDDIVKNPKQVEGFDPGKKMLLQTAMLQRLEDLVQYHHELLKLEAQGKISEKTVERNMAEEISHLATAAKYFDNEYALIFGSMLKSRKGGKWFNEEFIPLMHYVNVKYKDNKVLPTIKSFFDKVALSTIDVREALSKIKPS